ncbi:Adenylyltransferase and sulfurtransferase MOCS3 [Asimina triloba]
MDGGNEITTETIVGKELHNTAPSDGIPDKVETASPEQVQEQTRKAKTQNITTEGRQDIPQIIHAEAYIGQSKVKSAAAACRAYDVVIDATDNAPSRYMISDCCVVLGKPLVSGAALGLEGQLTVYNHDGGPCYRCLFPVPPPTTACQRCSDSGVLGVVPGVIGCLQALEAIKIASAVGEPLSGRMLLFDALSGRIRIVPPKLNLLPGSARITSKDYNDRVDRGEPHILVDVRPSHHFKITSLPKSLNIPLSCLESKLPQIRSALKEEEGGLASGASASLYVICRRGNDSQRAVQYLHKMGLSSAQDIIGGLESWAQDVDPSFPTY